MALITRKTKVTLNYLEEKPEVFKLQQIVLPAITTKQLIAECSNSCGVNPSQSKAVINALVDRLVHYMEIGHPVKVGEFGSFSPRIRTKVSTKLEKLSVENVKQKVIRFIPGAALRDMIGETSVQSAGKNLDDVE